MPEKPTKFYSNIQENKIAKSLNWDTVPASGARFGYPGDVMGRDWLCECKTHTTPGKKVVFTASVWDKLRLEASVKHRIPALFVDDGSQRLDRTWVLFPYLLVMTTSMILRPFPMKFKTNITFNHDEMLAQYKIAFSRYQNKFGIFSVNMGGLEYGVTTFAAFRLAYGDV